MATLESHNHIIGDIERGLKLYERGCVEFMEYPVRGYGYIADIPEKGDSKRILVNFTHDGLDIESFFCIKCTPRHDGALCRHVVAAVLAIQGGVSQSKLKIGKSASASVTVNVDNSAKAVGSGSLDVYATPMMAALVERAACECLSECLEPGQTSVGTEINLSHTAASPIGAVVTATATIEAVSGRKVEFNVTASDGAGEIGNGRHTRVIVDAERFMKKAGDRK
jgi:predicted thioesterase